MPRMEVARWSSECLIFLMIRRGVLDCSVMMATTMMVIEEQENSRVIGCYGDQYWGALALRLWELLGEEALK